jgi:hypothetical protein
MRVKISRVAIRRYIEKLQELASADPASDSVEVEFSILDVGSSKHQRQVGEIMPAGYGEAPDVEFSAPSPNGKTARKILKSKLRNAETLTICDPYILDKPKSENVKDYVGQLLSVLPLDTLRSLDVVYDASRENPSVFRELRRRLSKSSITCRRFADDSIHDRVWIVDKNSAFVVGTSFGGLGKRLAFLLDLPYDDLANFKKYLFRSRKPMI